MASQRISIRFDYEHFQTVNLTDRILDEAIGLGFDIAGLVAAGPLPHVDELDAWLARGFHGEMGYMLRRAAMRRDPREIMPTARSVVALAVSYHQRAPGPIAAYARAADYHDVLRERLRELARAVKSLAGNHVKTRWCIDTAPILERDVAWLAGLGWLGKNCCLIHPELGSFLLLAELCVSIDLPPPTSPRTRRRDSRSSTSLLHPDRCGTCTRCLDACPTDAFVARNVLDARRCIAYLTIELRGSIPPALREGIGKRLFGCDVCQDVCPWNRKAPLGRDRGLAPLLALSELQGEELLELDDDAFEARFAGTSLHRTGRAGLARNACVVLGNGGGSLDEDATIELLSRVLVADPSAMVRGHAAWALGARGGDRALAALTSAREREADGQVLAEIDDALAVLGARG